MRAGRLCWIVLFGSALALTPATAQPYFTNITTQSGLDGVQAFRIAVGDLNNDGYPDILVHLEPDHASADVLDKQLLYMNEDDGSGNRIFVDRTAGSGIRDNRAGTTDGRHSDAAIFGDVDNDGDLDIFTNVYLHRNYTLNEGTNELLINDGNASFSLSPNSTFHNETNWNTPAAVFVDYDNDSNLDLYIGVWYNPNDTLTQDHLYRGGGDGSFTDVSVSSGIASLNTCVYAVAAFDWDDDGDQDLFAPPYSRSISPSNGRHWRNNGDGTFTEIGASTNYDDFRGTPYPLTVSFGTMPRDYDNDGDIDFFEIMTHGGTNALGVWSTVAVNVNDVFDWDFAAITDRGLEDPDMAHHGDHFASWFDFDGDTLVDVVVTESGYGNPGLYLFQQQSDHTLKAVTISSGLWEVNAQGWSPGYVTPADIDRDGDEDLLVTTDNGLKLYRNDVGTDNSWVALQLEGVGAPGYANKSAIGARVEVTAAGVTQTQEVYAGNGHEGPMRPLTLYFGLGNASNIDDITVRWPNSALTLQSLTDVAVNQLLAIAEPCDGATDPTGLTVDKSGSDLLLAWDDPALGGVTWNVYRDGSPDPAGWGAAHATGVTDQDEGTPGIQWTDAGATAGGSHYYLITATNVCGETPLR